MSDTIPLPTQNYRDEPYRRDSGVSRRNERGGRGIIHVDVDDRQQGGRDHRHRDYPDYRREKRGVFRSSNQHGYHHDHSFQNKLPTTTPSPPPTTLVRIMDGGGSATTSMLSNECIKFNSMNYVDQLEAQVRCSSFTNKLEQNHTSY